MITASNETLPVIAETNPTDGDSNKKENILSTVNKNQNSNEKPIWFIWLYIAIGLIAITAIIITIVFIRKKKKAESDNDIYSNSDRSVKK